MSVDCPRGALMCVAGAGANAALFAAAASYDSVDAAVGDHEAVKAL